jgi:GNAT superfamily N-acetyltransferase
MQFELTDAAIDDILFYMENQNGDFLFDSAKGEVVAQDSFEEYGEFDSGSAQDDILVENGERYYQLPEWSSIDGFRLMEHFAGSLRNPPAKQALNAVLQSGKGVFRGFKNVLSQFPEVEKNWYLYKDAQMKKVIRKWYNDLRETWHLERLDFEIEDYSEAVLDDFIFRDAEQKDMQSINEALQKTASYFRKNFDDKASGAVFADLWLKMNVYSQETKPEYIVAETPAGAFCAVGAVAKTSEQNTDTRFVSMIFVEKEFRGLGLGKAMLEKIIEKCEKENISRLVTVNLLLPEGFVHVLLQYGFERYGSGYVLKLVSNGR